VILDLPFIEFRERLSKHPVLFIRLSQQTQYIISPCEGQIGNADCGPAVMAGNQSAVYAIQLPKLKISDTLDRMLI